MKYSEFFKLSFPLVYREMLKSCFSRNLKKVLLPDEPQTVCRIVVLTAALRYWVLNNKPSEIEVWTPVCYKWNASLKVVPNVCLDILSLLLSGPLGCSNSCLRVGFVGLERWDQSRRCPHPFLQLSLLSHRATNSETDALFLFFKYSLNKSADPWNNWNRWFKWKDGKCCQN